MLVFEVFSLKSWTQETRLGSLDSRNQELDSRNQTSYPQLEAKD